KDASAEKLYRQAAKLYADKDLFALKTALDKLKSDFPNSQAVTDTNHDPSFATMSKAVANLGVLITVRQDGKGDCKTIREAVLSAPPKSVIEVQDSGTYHPGNITLKGSTLRGAKGKWPVLSGGKHGMVNINLSGEGCRVEGLVILDSGANYSININNKNTQKCRLRRLIIVKRNGWCHIPEDVQGTLLDGCLIIKSAPARLPGSHRTGVVTMRNCIWLNGDPESKAPVLFENCFLPSFKAGAPTEFERCTVLGNLTFPDTGGSVLNSIVGRITVTGAEVKIGFCNMLNKKPVAGSAKPDKTCFSIDPQFRNPAKYDYNLKPSSPCRRKGDGGKGVGCVYTPEMIQILKKALQLRKDKILKWDD
nr:hypothetical protein [Planctomycetota bacterium]